MTNQIKKIIIFAGLTVLVWGQFRADLPKLNTPEALHDRLNASSYSLFDPERFDMQHGFSVSMARWGGQTLSVGSYTNQMTFILKKNLRLRTNFTLMQPGNGSALSPTGGLGNQFFYGASIDYQPLENTLLHFSFNNYPIYQRHLNSPFELDIR